MSIVHPLDSIPVNLIPTANPNADEVQIYSQIYETLLRPGPDGKTLVGKLARDWDYSEDHRVLTVNLKADIRFHDGTLLDADVAKTSIEWQKEHGNSPFLAIIDSVTTLDDLTIQIWLSNPDSRFLYYLASRKGIVMLSSKSILANTVLEMPIGSGPFFYEMADSNEIILSSFPDYREKGGNVEKIIFRYFPYSEKLKEAFIDGEVDIVYTVDGFSIDRMQWTGMAKYIVEKPVQINMLGFNLKHPVAGQKAFRQAVRASLDLVKIYTNLNRGGSIPAVSPLPSVYPDLGDLRQPAYDEEQGRRLVREMKLQDRKIPFFYPSPAYLRATTMKALEAKIGKIGIVLEMVDFSSWSTYQNAILSDSSAIFVTGWKADIIGDAGYLLSSMFESTSAFNFYHFRNETVDRLLRESRREFDDERRQELYRQILTIVLEETPVIFLNHLKEYYAYNSRKIRYITMNPYGIINYNDVVLYETD